MLHRCEIQSRSIKALILDAWEQDKEKLLRNLGGIDSGHRDEEPTSLSVWIGTVLH